MAEKLQFSKISKKTISEANLLKEKARMTSFILLMCSHAGCCIHAALVPYSSLITLAYRIVLPDSGPSWFSHAFLSTGSSCFLFSIKLDY